MSNIWSLPQKESNNIKYPIYDKLLAKMWITKSIICVDDFGGSLS